MNTLKLFRYEWKSPVGELIMMATEQHLCLCDWKYRKMRAAIDRRILNFYQSDIISRKNDIIEQTITQLEEYFSSQHRSQFDIPLECIGTDFQKKVWASLMKIEYGKTMSYLQLARQMGDEKAVRAVATANGANAISIIIPCHRIIGSNGEMVGYAGGLNAKKNLLAMESGIVQKILF